MHYLAKKMNKSITPWRNCVQIFEFGPTRSGSVSRSHDATLLGWKPL